MALSKEEKLDRQKKKEQTKETSERVFNMLFVEDELSWKDMIYSLIDQENMDPWDIDITLLSQKFLDMLKKLKELDFRISGKMVLASAILLKMKSDILIDEDIAHFDSMMNNTEENMPIEVDGMRPVASIGDIQLFPRTPQPRKRKVSIFDLVKALEKALEVESKRKKYKPDAKKITMKIPDKRFDIGKSMEKVYGKVESYYKNKKTKDQTLTFDELVGSNSKQDKVLTFIPLLHLDNLRKIDLNQEKHFETINVRLAKLPDDDKTAPEN